MWRLFTPSFTLQKFINLTIPINPKYWWWLVSPLFPDPGTFHVKRYHDQPLFQSTPATLDLKDSLCDLCRFWITFSNGIVRHHRWQKRNTISCVFGNKSGNTNRFLGNADIQSFTCNCNWIFPELFTLIAVGVCFIVFINLIFSDSSFHFCIAHLIS